jgi:hypothetical protein
VSPWVEPGSVYNEEYRHTSLIATLRMASPGWRPLAQAIATEPTTQR